MQRILGMVLMICSVSAVAFGQAGPTPEIDAASAGSAITLAVGALLVYRARRR